MNTKGAPAAGEAADIFTPGPILVSAADIKPVKIEPVTG